MKKKKQLPATLKLWDPTSSLLTNFSDLQPYLQSYDLPSPQKYRYGNCFFESRQPKFRVRIFAQAWQPSHPLGTIFLLHGYHEHAGNYSRLIHNFLEAHYSVAIMDMRGHGLSEGPRGHLDSPTCYVEDLEQWMELATPVLLHNNPVYLWGHSLGGQVCLQYLLRQKQNQIKGSHPTIQAACLSSPMLGFPTLTGFRKVLFHMAPILAKLFPSLPVPTGFERGAISSDENYLRMREADPLIQATTTPLWVANTIKNIAWLHENAPSFDSSTPTLLLLAGEEKIANLVDARNFAFHAYKLMKHKIIEFPGILHELEKEPSARDRVLRESIAWFASHNKK